MHPQRTGCVKCGAGGAGRQSDDSRNTVSRDVSPEHLAAARGLRAAELNTRGQVAAHNVSRQRDKKVRAGRACVGRATVHEKRVGNRDTHNAPAADGAGKMRAEKSGSAWRNNAAPGMR